jgi:hypothetical protein
MSSIRTSEHWRKIVLRLLISIAIVLNIGLLLDDGIVLLAKKVWGYRAMDAKERSAMIAFGRNFKDYMAFIRDNVPEDAILLTPPASVDTVLGHQGLMNYYLFPRQLSNCPANAVIESCILSLRGPNTYFIAVRSFPPRSAAEEVKEFIPYDDQRGIYVPKP